MEEPRQCSLCSQPLSSDLIGFCPFCGGPVIDNSLLNSKSTANYDPTSRDWKPWREKVVLPKRNYKLRTDKPKPWYPTMRVESRRLPKRSQPQQSIAQTTETIDEGTELDIPSMSLSTDVAGTSANSNESNGHQGIVEASIAAITKEPFAKVREVVYPLAAYDLDLGDNSPKMVLIASIVEHLFGIAGSPRVYWLKVSATIDEDDDQVHDNDLEPASSSTEKERVEFPTVYLSNMVCWLIYPNDEWTDLDKAR